MPEKQATQSKSGQKLTDISPKKTYRWLTNTWKDAQHHSLLEKSKSKLQWGITSHWSEWPSSRKTKSKENLQAISAGEDVENRELYLLFISPESTLSCGILCLSARSCHYVYLSVLLASASIHLPQERRSSLVTKDRYPQNSSIFTLPGNRKVQSPFILISLASAMW